MSYVSSPNRSSSAARASALLYPVLVAPAVLLFLVTALLQRDARFLTAGLELFGAGAIAGGLTGLLVFALQPAQGSPVDRFVGWAISLGVPLLATGSVFWRYVLAPRIGALATSDIVSLMVILPVAVSAILLTADISR